MRLDSSEYRDLRGDSRARTPQPAQASRGTLREPRRLWRPPGTPHPRAHTHGAMGFTGADGPRANAESLAWGEGVTPPAHSLHAWPAARPASASSAPRVLRPPWRGCPTSRRRSGRRGVAQPHPPSGTLGWNRFSPRLEHGAFYCADASDAQTSRVESRAGTASLLPGCLAEDRSCDDKSYRASKRALLGSQALTAR